VSYIGSCNSLATAEFGQSGFIPDSPALIPKLREYL
jgi:hypothetical protein